MSSQSTSKGLHLPSLSIEGFRAIRGLSIDRLGRVTLISGKNNTGKTSILEAVRILVEGGARNTIREILQRREEHISFNEDFAFDYFLVSPLFHGFPEIDDFFHPIVISTRDGSREVQLEVKWLPAEIDRRGIRRISDTESEVVEWDSDLIPALVVTTEETVTTYRIDSLHRHVPSRQIGQHPASSRKFPSARYVNSSSAERTSMLGSLWDSISLTESEQHVLEALQILDESIIDMSMIGERSSRRAIVQSRKFTQPVPLRSFGDGMNRLFGIILTLVNVSGGILLIDEFENGLHHTLQVKAWDLIFRLATKLNVQILATTHSFDCVAAFAQVAVVHEEIDGLMVRIEQHENQMRVVDYTEQDLLVAALQRIEVR